MAYLYLPHVHTKDKKGGDVGKHLAFPIPDITKPEEV